MAYSTQTQVEQKIATARLLKIGDRDEDGILDATVFTDAASQAQAWIQSYCAPRYGATVLAAWDTATPSLIRHVGRGTADPGLRGRALRPLPPDRASGGQRFRAAGPPGSVRCAGHFLVRRRDLFPGDVVSGAAGGKIKPG